MILCKLDFHKWEYVTIHWTMGGPGMSDSQCQRCGILKWEDDVRRPHGKAISEITKRIRKPIHPHPMAKEV